MNSGLFSLNWADFAKGLVMAVLGAVAALIQASVDAGTLNFDWKKIGTYAALTAITYILKNFVTGSSGGILKKQGLDN